ncbi:MAG: ABC transporter ATP-binding protein [Steroidobacteraceae bacterium]
MTGETQNIKIRIDNVGKRFQTADREITALSEINLEVHRGEFVCIVGPSGCGKTTLLRIVAGLEEASSGSIEMIRSKRPERAGLPLSNMVFQEQSLFPWMSVLDNVAFGLKARGVPKAERRRIADVYITKVGLARVRDAYPHQLSGGMKQRVSIARAFANDPDVLLMDEPFGALDEQTKFVLQEELLRIWEGSHKTVLYITHSIDEAILLSDRILVMSAHPGRIKEIIDVHSVFSRPRHVEDTKASPMFGELFRRIWTSLQHDVVATAAE